MPYWFGKIQKPILGLAPMFGYSDSDLRYQCRQYGADAVYSEMVAAEAVIRRVPKIFEMMNFSESERPIVIQIFGSNPKSMAEAAQMIEKELKPDGIDINFGCPVQKASKQGFGAVQLADPESAAEIVACVSKALKNTPLSCKMRFPDKDPKLAMDFVEKIYHAGAKLVAIHGRTATQKYGGSADWQPIYEIKTKFPELFVLGNGDIRTFNDLKSKLGNLDGVLVGRAAKINPAVFLELKKIKN